MQFLDLMDRYSLLSGYHLLPVSAYQFFKICHFFVIFRLYSFCSVWCEDLYGIMEDWLSFRRKTKGRRNFFQCALLALTKQLPEDLLQFEIGWQRNLGYCWSLLINVWTFFASTPRLLDVLLGGAGVLPYMGYIGMCRCEGYVLQAIYSRIGYINQSVWV